MTPLLKTFKAGPTAPKVVLLPDAVFFTRAIPVPPDATSASVGEQVELALETLSPFPPAQLYHGFYWPTGADRVLVFAAYRRRFSTDQVTEWESAEVVLPTFASLLAAPAQSNTTWVLPSAEGLTAVHWDKGEVPAKVEFRAVPPEADGMERQRVQDQLLAAFPGNRAVVLEAAPEIDLSGGDRELVFRTGALESRLTAAQFGAMDVRDKEALAALRRARARDLALWRTFLGFAALLVLLGLGELALIGGRFWQESRRAQANAQRPVVERIAAAQNLTTRINELSTKRLLPFEMLDIVGPARPPNAIQFVRVATSGLYSLNIEARTTQPAALATYRAALSALPAVERVEVPDQRTRDNTINFTIVVTFKPEMLKPVPTS
jgi:hypothetical protein